MKKNGLLILVTLLAATLKASAQQPQDAPFFRDVPWSVSINPSNAKETIIDVNLSDEPSGMRLEKVAAVVQYRDANRNVIRTDTIKFTESLPAKRQYRKVVDNGFQTPVTVKGLELKYIRELDGRFQEGMGIRRD